MWSWKNAGGPLCPGRALLLVAAVEKPSSEVAFEFGLSLLIGGLVRKDDQRSAIPLLTL